ncbi:MAG: glycosyltransferase [Bacteroidetes bacterium]|nr:glycosyltransferase [Bacteroidota bacterium]
MRICFVNTNKDWGGAEKWHLEMAVHLSSKGHDVLALVYPASPLFQKLKKNGISCIPVKSGNLGFLNPFRIATYKRIFKESYTETVILNLPSDLKTAGKAARKAGVKHIIYRRGSAIPIRNTWLNRYIFSHYVDFIITNSKETGRTILKNNPALFDPEKIKVIYNGIDLTSLDNRITKELFQKQQEQILLGNLSRLSHQKGLGYLIQIAGLLRDKGLNFHLYLAGDGELKNELQEQVRRMNLADHITFLGFVEDTKSFLNSIDILLVTSIWEGFGYSIAEGMACSKPVVAFDISSNPELITDNETGYLIEPFDIKAFAEKTIKLANDKILRHTFGKAARIKVEEQFEISQAFRSLEKFVSEL